MTIKQKKKKIKDKFYNYNYEYEYNTIIRIYMFKKFYKIKVIFLTFLYFFDNNLFSNID